MIVWLLVFVVMLLVVAGMAVGVMAGRKPIAGSCGGIANLGIEKSCGICGNDFTKCTSNQLAPRPARPPATRPRRTIWSARNPYKRQAVRPASCHRLPDSWPAPFTFTGRNDPSTAAAPAHLHGT